MKKLATITAVVSGVLLLLVPRYILPACEYEGYPHMHCSDTARAEYIVGVLLLAIGGATSFAKTLRTVVVGAVVSSLLYGAAFWLPDIVGYCQSSRMPCNYGMVPGVRFIAVAGAAIMIIAIVSLLKTSRKKGNP